MKKTLISLIFLAFMATTLPLSVFAGILNSDSADFEVLRVGNVTQNPGTTSANWNTAVSANPGDVISFAIYYHNTSQSQVIRDVRVKLTPKTTGISTSHDFNAVVWGENTNPVYGKARVYLSAPAKLEFANNSVKWRPNQQVYSESQLPNNQNGNNIFSSRGISLGDIYPGWSTQGNVMIGFSVPQAQHINPAPSPYVTAQTMVAEGIRKSGATIRGSVSSNYSTTKTWFEWGPTSSLGNKTNNMIVNTGSGSKYTTSTIDGLSLDTIYYYRLVAETTGRTSYGETMIFRTLGNGYVTPTPVYKDYNISIEKIVKNIDTPNGTRIETVAKRGDTVRFTITVKNTGGYDLRNLEIRDRLDDSLRLVNDLDKDSDKENSRKVVWLVDELRSGEEKEVFFEALVAEDARIGSILRNGGDRTVVESGSLSRTSNEVFVEVANNIPSGGAAAIALSGAKVRVALFIFILMVIILAVVYRIFKS